MIGRRTKNAARELRLLSPKRYREVDGGGNPLVYFHLYTRIAIAARDIGMLSAR